MDRTQFAAAAALLIVGASLTTAPGAGAAVGDAVVYTVTSDAPLSAISYSDATGVTQVLPNQPSPWTLSFTSKDSSPGAMLVVTAVPTGKQTSCQISVNGTVKETKSSTGSGDSAQVICGFMG
jgi:Mycobacterium membrane protein